MPLDSGVKTAGLALMGQTSTKMIFETETSTYLDAENRAEGIAYLRQGAAFANFAGRVENSYLRKGAT